MLLFRLSMKLVVIGAGYVGLVTAAVFAQFGNSVIVVEIDKNRIRQLSEGKIPFFEPGLEELIKSNVKTERLSITDSYQKAIPQSEIIFLCVGTPTKNGRADLSSIYSSVKSIAENLKNKVTVVIKSTVPPGTNEKVRKVFEKTTKVEIELASVPEFLREGKAIEDTLHPYRVVIGARNKDTIKKLLKLHQKISGKRMVCSPESAQMIKYASNAFLPSKISFANSIARICDNFGINIEEVMKGMGMDKRIGPDFLNAGLGYGGSCFPKDIDALLYLSESVGYDFSILKVVKKTNNDQVDFFVNKIISLCSGSVKGKILVVLGLSFKPNTSDMREARSLYVIHRLQKLGAVVRACDPVAISEAVKVLCKADFYVDPYEALKGADGLVLVTEWDEYKNLDFVKIKKIMKSPIVADGRNIYNREGLEKLGFTYEGIGK